MASVDGEIQISITLSEEEAAKLKKLLSEHIFEDELFQDLYTEIDSYIIEVDE